MCDKLNAYKKLLKTEQVLQVEIKRLNGNKV